MKDRLVLLPPGVTLLCSCCHTRKATCVGRYESMRHWEPACDTCCGHGNEDGKCYEIQHLSLDAKGAK